MYNFVEFQPFLAIINAFGIQNGPLLLLFPPPLSSLLSLPSSLHPHFPILLLIRFLLYELGQDCHLFINVFIFRRILYFGSMCEIWGF